MESIVVPSILYHRQTDRSKTRLRHRKLKDGFGGEVQWEVKDTAKPAGVARFALKSHLMFSMILRALLSPILVGKVLFRGHVSEPYSRMEKMESINPKLFLVFDGLMSRAKMCGGFLFYFFCQNCHLSFPFSFLNKIIVCSITIQVNSIPIH